MKLPYPKTFPTADEEAFLKLITCPESEFAARWDTWKQHHSFEDLDFSKTMLAPMVYLRMERTGLQADRLFNKMKGVYRKAWVRNQSIVASAKSFIVTCQQHRIPVMILKGLTMVTQIYPDIGARFSGDADLMIHPEHAPTIISLLKKLGWHSKDRGANVPASAYHVFRTETFDNGGITELDVHLNIHEIDHATSILNVLLLRPLPMLHFRKTAWNDAVSTQLDDQTCERLSNEDILIHAITHGAGGSPRRELRWVIDALTIVETLPIDWNKLIARAREYGTLIDVIVAFSYLKERFNISIPQYFLDQLQLTHLDKKAIRNYYYKTRTVKRYALFGTLPLIWYAYWKFEPKKDRKGLIGFLNYACAVWGLPNLRALPGFVFDKYHQRVQSWSTD